ncbi:MAG: 50S ribosomal protein L25 [Candidatus Aenigmarchaeota archaeon]|nr:50S ribosomal protein L25 [Candidatus Aenigmarchaeota archaeon]
METITLKAKKREVVGKKVKKLRKEGFLPAVLYGRDTKNENLSILKAEFEKIFKKAGLNKIVSLVIEGEGKKNVLIHEPQVDPVTNNPLHVDLYQVKMTEKITTNVPLVFIGESKAVREMDGTLVKNRDEIEVECLPTDLPSGIEVDITSLIDFESTIHIKDLKIPAGVTVLDDPEETVALVEPPRSEEELAELEEPVVEEISTEEEAKEEVLVEGEVEEGRAPEETQKEETQG